MLMLYGHLGWRALEPRTRIGFATLAEFFFLLSGATLGVVAARLAGTGREQGLGRRLLRRGLWLWAAHLVLVAIYRLLTGPVFPAGDLRRLWRGVEPAWTWLGFDQPSVLNVLPRYALFLVLAPGALALVRRGRHGLLLGLSLGLWLAHWGSGGALLLPGLEQSRAPYPSAGWQLLFFGGFALAHLWSVRAGPAPPRWIAAALVASSALLTAVFVALAGSPFGRSLPEAWISRPLLGPLRLINLLAAAALAATLVSRWRRPLARWAGWLLEPFGRNALPAFLLHIPLVWALLFVPGLGHDDDLRKPVAAALVLLLLPLVRRPGIRRWLAP